MANSIFFFKNTIPPQNQHKTSGYDRLEHVVAAWILVPVRGNPVPGNYVPVLDIVKVG